ncbi:Clavaminate synthase-like protein [Daldinia sp. FL1419]|nr:Clavaminate synthase-like protein [Daldinia sp. FL1419]
MSRFLLSSRGLQTCSGRSSLNSGLRQTFINRADRYRYSVQSICKNETGFQPTTQPRRFSTVGRNSIARPGENPLSTRVSISHKRGLATQAERETPQIRLRDDDTVYLFYENQKPIVLDRHWLRDACRCSECVNPDSGQKNFGTCDVPPDLPISEVTIAEDGNLKVVWENDFMSSGSHTSYYSDFYLKVSQSEYELPGATLWDRAIFERDRLTIDYNDWIAGEHGFLSGLHRLYTHGLIFLRNVPYSEESVITIANQIGNLQETFYGRTWDVRSKPNAENVAYTNAFLGLHQDLLYVHDTPRLQFLHCLENTCEGGESMFSDGTRASHLMEFGPRIPFEYLLSRNVRYRYDKHGHHYQQSRPIITKINKYQHLVAWSPPFQASNQRISKSATGSLHHREWLEAATAFRHLLEDRHWMYQYRMQPGECVIFDNLRVLHGRKQFDTSSGSRWFKGAYIADDVFKSKLITKSKELMELGGGDQNSFLYQSAAFNVKYKIWSGGVTMNRMAQLGIDVRERNYSERDGVTISYV